VETGDGGPSGQESPVYASFLIEEDPVYAEQTVEVESTQLFSRCGVAAAWFVGRTPEFGPTTTVVLDKRRECGGQLRHHQAPAVTDF
jgi:hypothetical protein